MIVAKTKLDNEIFNIIIYAIKNTTKVIIPKTIKSILFYASNDSTLETIGNYAFCNISIEFITIPPNVTTIGKCIFYNCEQLKSVNLPR